MSKHILPLVAVLLPLFAAAEVKAQIVINEVLNNPSGKEEGAEWVELYNLGATPLSLKECVLYLDDSSVTQKIIFAEDAFIEKFKVISWDYSWLNNQGDIVKLECPGFRDELVYGETAGATLPKPPEGKTLGRNPDGTGNFMLLNEPTLNGVNSSAPTTSPTYTPTPMPTPKPTATPKPTPTSKPTVTLLPAIEKNTTETESAKQFLATSTATVSPTPTPPDEGGKTGDNYASSGITGTNETGKVTGNEVSVLGAKTISVNPYAISAIIAGATMLFVSVFGVIKDYKKRYNLKDEQ